MKRLAAVFLSLGALAAFAVAGFAQDRISGDAIRDRIRDRMEQRRLERVPLLAGAATVAGAGIGFESIVIAGKSRSFLRYTPNRLLGQRAPVVFALHGAKGTADRVSGYLGLNAVADREGFVVVYPQGEKNRWNDGRMAGKAGGSEVSGANDGEFLNGLADALIGQGVADAKRIYLLGISNGGFMGFALACDSSSRFAAYAGVVSSMPAEGIAKCQPGRPVPLMMVNGTADELIRYDGAPGKFGISGNAPPMEVARHFASLAGCRSVSAVPLPDTDASDGTKVVLSSWSGCAPGSGVMFYSVDGGGHQAPSRGKTAGGVVLETFLGARNRDLDTAEAAWAFFKEFRR